MIEKNTMTVESGKLRKCSSMKERSKNPIDFIGSIGLWRQARVQPPQTDEVEAWEVLTARPRGGRGHLSRGAQPSPSVAGGQVPAGRGSPG